MNIAHHLLESNKKSIFVYLGHQILCRQLGFTVLRKQVPFQGVQKKIDLFRKNEIVGFYNTFVASHPELSGNIQTSSDQETGEIHAIQAQNFTGFQFHPESILTKNGYRIIEENIQSLLAS